MRTAAASRFQMSSSCPRSPRLPRTNVVKPNQVDVLARAVFRDFQQIDHAGESGLARQLRRDVRESYGLDGVDFNLAVIHGVAASDRDVQALPDSDRAGDVARLDAVAKAL